MSKTKYHISPKKGPSVCVATVKGCKYGNSTPHYDTFVEAKQAFEKQNEARTFRTLSKRKQSDYELMMEWKQQKKERRRKRGLKTLAVAGVGIVAIGMLDNIIPPRNNGPEETNNDATITQPVVKEETAGDVRKDTTANTIDYGQKIEDGVKDVVGSLKDVAEDYLNDSNSVGTVLSTNSSSSTSNDVLFRGESIVPSQQEVDTAYENLRGLEIRDVYNGQFGEYNRDDWGSHEKSKSPIQQRDIPNGTFNSDGRVVSGSFVDPYTGVTIDVEQTELNLDHIVALGEAHYSQTRELSPEEKNELANDSRNLQYTSGSVNKGKSDKDAGEWLPSYDPASCSYAIANIEVKSEYDLSVDSREYRALKNVLDTKCS